MDITKLEELAELMKRYGLSALTVKEDGNEVHMEKTIGCPAPEIAGTPPVPAAVAESIPQAGTGEKEIRSPMVGVFYVAGSPDSEPFVSIGQHVGKGDILCVIEAMKLMNEISAERDCVISDICVENGQLVEYGQCLFKYI